MSSYRYPNVMGVPSYDNGAGYTKETRKIRSVPARRPEIQMAPRVQSHPVGISQPAPPRVGPAPYAVAPLNVIRRKPVAPASGAAAYINRPLPPLPGTAAAASRPQGVSKPSTLNLSKPLPVIPHHPVVPVVPAVRSTNNNNNVYTATGQRVAGPVEVSAWSNTTESSRAARRRQKRDKNLQSHGATLLNAARPGKTTKAPELTKTPQVSRNQPAVSRPAQDPRRVENARYIAEQQAAGRHHTRRVEDAQRVEAESQARMAAALRAIVPGRYGIHKDTLRTPQWRVLNAREQAIVTRQYEQDNARRYQAQARSGRKNSTKCFVM